MGTDGMLLLRHNTMLRRREARRLNGALLRQCPVGPRFARPNHPLEPTTGWSFARKRATLHPIEAQRPILPQ